MKRRRLCESHPASSGRQEKGSRMRCVTRLNRKFAVDCAVWTKSASLRKIVPASTIGRKLSQNWTKIAQSTKLQRRSWRKKFATPLASLCAAKRLPNATRINQEASQSRSLAIQLTVLVFHDQDGVGLLEPRKGSAFPSVGKTQSPVSFPLQLSLGGN